MSTRARGDTFSLKECLDFTAPSVRDRIETWTLEGLCEARGMDMRTMARYDDKTGLCARQLRHDRCTGGCGFTLHLLGSLAATCGADPSSVIDGTTVQRTGARALARCLCGAPLHPRNKDSCSLGVECLLAAQALVVVHNAPPRNPPLPVVAFAVGAGPNLRTDVSTRNAILDAAALITGRKKPVVTKVVFERCKYHVDGEKCPGSSCHRLHVIGRGGICWSSKSSGDLCYCGAESKKLRKKLFVCTSGESCPLHTKSMLLIADHGTNIQIWFPPGSAADLSDTAVRQTYLDEVALLKRLLAENPTGTRLLAAHHATAAPPDTVVDAAMQGVTPTVASTAPTTSMDAAGSSHEADVPASSFQGGGHATVAATLGLGDGTRALAATVPTKPAVAPSLFVASYQETSSAPTVDAQFDPTAVGAFAADEPPLPPPRGLHSEAVELAALQEFTTKMKVSPPRMRTADRAAGLAQFEDEPRPGTADTADTAPVAPKRELEFSSPKRNKAKASIGAADGSRKPQFKKSPMK